MKVLMFGWEFPPHNSGGLGVACHGLTKALSNQGAEIVFVLPKKIKIEKTFFKIKFANSKPLKIISIDSSLTPYLSSHQYSRNEEKAGALYGRNLFEEVNRYARLAKRVAASEPHDVIHAHDWLTFPAGMEAKKNSKKPLVAHVHATEFDRTGGLNVNQKVYDIERAGLGAADKIIAVSNYTKDKIVSHYGIDPNKIEVVHNAVDPDDWQSGGKDEHPSRTQRGAEIAELKKKNKIVLFIGRLTLQKGPDYFLSAARKVVDYYPDVLFVFAGSGDMERKLIEGAAWLGLADKVKFVGFLRDAELEKLYRAADLFVMPSVSEPFGIAPLEALTCGTPVLISKQSGVAETLKHCLKVDFWDIDEMANKILSILKYGQLREHLKEQGGREVGKFSWQEAAARCLGIYKGLTTV